ncbi:hypothetical protein C8R45DRAFT_603574 [Mycena sanguinolenta]|nr:hypothetical protein C8R45DRAFT_603574 [Mycena sanguinolenta]
MKSRTDADPYGLDGYDTCPLSCGTVSTWSTFWTIHSSIRDRRGTSHGNPALPASRSWQTSQIYLKALPVLSCRLVSLSVDSFLHIALQMLLLCLALGNTWRKQDLEMDYRKRHQTARSTLFLFEWLYVTATARNHNAISALPPLKRDPALFLTLTPTVNPPTTRMSLKLKPLRLKPLIQSPPSEPPRNSFTSTDYYRKTRDEYYSPISYMESSSPGSPYADLPEISSPSSAGLVRFRHIQLHFIQAECRATFTRRR